MKKIVIYRNPLKVNALGGFLLDKDVQDQSKCKRDNGLAILNEWEEELKVKNQISKVKSAEKNESKKISDSKC